MYFNLVSKLRIEIKCKVTHYSSIKRSDLQNQVTPAAHKEIRIFRL